MDMNILSKYYSLTAIDLSQKIKSENPDLKQQMETQKIINLLIDSSNEESKFATKVVCYIQSNSKR